MKIIALILLILSTIGGITLNSIPKTVSDESLKSDTTRLNRKIQMMSLTLEKIEIYQSSLKIQKL